MPCFATGMIRNVRTRGNRVFLSTGQCINVGPELACFAILLPGPICSLRLLSLCVPRLLTERLRSSPSVHRTSRLKPGGLLKRSTIKCQMCQVRSDLFNQSTANCHMCPLSGINSKRPSNAVNIIGRRTWYPLAVSLEKAPIILFAIGLVSEQTLLGLLRPLQS